MTQISCVLYRCHQMEKKAKNFDKIVAEWKSKIDSLQVRIDVIFGIFGCK